MYNLIDNMIGGYYPLFMGNEELGDAGYVYQLTTPSYSKTTLKPYISMTKVCDYVPSKTGEKTVSMDNDILFNIMDEPYRNTFKDDKGNIDRSKINWAGQVRRLIDAKAVKIIPNIQRGGFPLIEISGTDLDVQKSLILNLRAALKWRKYKISAGKKIDILWTRTKYAVFEIVGDGDFYSLKPVGMYANSDIRMKNDLTGDYVFEPLERFSKKVPEFLSGIKELEAGFITRRDF